LSLHVALLGAWWHPVSSQVSVVQPSPSSQFTRACGGQTLLAQVRAGWYTRPAQPGASHCTELAAKTQPDAGLHESVVHRLLSSHAVAGPPVQAPPEQVSSDVQGLLSLHAVPLLSDHFVGSDARQARHPFPGSSWPTG
jgi:hypothetical protein